MVSLTRIRWTVLNTSKGISMTLMKHLEERFINYLSNLFSSKPVTLKGVRGVYTYVRRIFLFDSKKVLIHTLLNQNKFKYPLEFICDYFSSIISHSSK